MVEDKSEKPLEPKDLQQVTKKTSLDETLESVERLSSKDIANNPAAIDLLIINYKESARETKDSKTRIDSLNYENREISKNLAVANERLRLKESFDKKLSIVSGIGGALIFFASFVEGKIWKIDIRIILTLLGLILLSLGIFGNLFKKQEKEERKEE